MKLHLLAALMLWCLPFSLFGATPDPAWDSACYPELPKQRYYTLPSQANWAQEDRQGRVWLGGQADFLPEKLSPQEIQAAAEKSILAAFKEPRPLVHGARMLMEDTAGRCWFAIQTGEYITYEFYDGKTITRCPMIVPKDKINSIKMQVYEDSAGRVWVNGSNEVSYFDGQKFEQLRLPGDSPTPDSKFFSRVIFVSSPDGLVQIDAEEKLFVFHQGKLLPLTQPGKYDYEFGFQSAWPLPGKRILFTGYRNSRAILEIKELTEADKATLETLLGKLDSEEFETREKAARELRTFLPRARDYLSNKLATLDGPEVKARLKTLLNPERNEVPALTTQDGEFTTSGILFHASPRGAGRLTRISSGKPDDTGKVEAQAEHWVWTDAQEKSITLITDEIAGSNVKFASDGQGFPILAEWRCGGYVVRDGKFVQAFPHEMDKEVQECMAVDRSMRAFVYCHGQFLIVYDPTAPEKKESVTWHVEPYVEWMHVTKDQGVLAYTGELSNDDHPKHPQRLQRWENGTWKLVDDSKFEPQTLAEGADGSLIIEQVNYFGSGRKFRLIETLNKAGEAKVYSTMAELVKACRNQILKNFDRPAWVIGAQQQFQHTRLAIDEKKQIWFMEPTGSQDATLWIMDTKGEVKDVTATIQHDFPTCTNPRFVMRLPGREGVLVHYHWYQTNEKEMPAVWASGDPEKLTLSAFLNKDGPFKTWAIWSTLVAQDGTVYWGDGLVLKPGKEEVEKGDEGWVPGLEYPAGTFWRWKTRKLPSGEWAGDGLEVFNANQRWHLRSEEALRPRSDGVVDAQGRVWFATANGIHQYQIDGKGPVEERSVPWDHAGRGVYHLYLEGSSRLWAFDSQAKEALYLDLNKLEKFTVEK